MSLADFFLQTTSPTFSNQSVGGRVHTSVLDGRVPQDTTSMALSRLSNQLSRNAAREDVMVGRNTPIGLDAVVQDWVRQEFIYRRSILQEMFLMAEYTVEIRAPMLALQRSVFQRGLGQWIPRFKSKCVNPECGKEYPIEVDECEDCYLIVNEEVTEFNEWGVPQRVINKVPVVDDETGEASRTPTRKPDERQKERLEDYMDDVSTFHQSLLDVLKEGFKDLLVADDMFILLNKEYTVDAEGMVCAQRIFEITRLHPSLVEFDIDRKDGLPERSHWVCPIHRDIQNATAPGTCDIPVGGGKACMAVLLPAMFRYYVRGHYRYFTRDEILHKSYFSPSRTYGISPVYTVFEKALTLRGIDRWYYRYFYERRIPPGLIITYTDDPDSLRGEIERVQLEMLDDPNVMPWIAASARTQRGRTDNVKLGYTFEEMDSISIRNEIRERIGNLWGVTPMEQGDARQAGGLARESAQTSMFDKTVESYQQVIDNGILDKIIYELGITDFKKVLAPPNEKSEQEIIELNKLDLDFATGAMQIGYKPKFIMDESGRAKFEYEEMPQPAMGGFGGGGAGFGGGGGMPGMMGGEQQLPPPPPAPLDDEGPTEENPPSMGGSSGQQPFPPPQ